MFNKKKTYERDPLIYCSAVLEGKHPWYLGGADPSPTHNFSFKLKNKFICYLGLNL